GVPALAYCHSNIVAMARLAAGRRFAGAAARVAERYARHVYRGFDLVLAPSRSMAAHLQDWGATRVACQPLGVDSDVFHPRARAPRRATGGASSPACSLTINGSWVRAQATPLAASATPALRRRCSDDREGSRADGLHRPARRGAVDAAGVRANARGDSPGRRR